MTLLRVAWRNLWRNRRRTLITLAATTMSTAILIWSDAIMVGMTQSMLGTVTQVSLGQVQVHAPEYTEDRSIYKVIEKPGAVLEAARKDGIGAAARSYGYGLVSCKVKSAGARFWGVDARDEKSTFDLAGSMESGSGVFLAGTRRGMVLGRKLARSLKAKVGDEIVAVVQAADGSLGNDLFTVAGILGSAGDEIDRSAAIISREDFAELFVTGGIHEIALNSKGKLAAEEVAEAVRPAAGGAQVETWRELMPFMAEMETMVDGSLWIMGLVFFLAAGLGVMNTMLMATYERIREFGVLKALGASPARIVASVTAEALMLGILSVLLGAVVGIAGGLWLEKVGINLTRWGGDEISFAGVMFDPIMRGELTTRSVLVPMAIICLTCVAAALWPAIRAARLKPVTAMTHV